MDSDAKSSQWVQQHDWGGEFDQLLNLINKPSLSENSPLWVACVKNATLYYHHLREWVEKFLSTTTRNSMDKRPAWEKALYTPLLLVVHEIDQEYQSRKISVQTCAFCGCSEIHTTRFYWTAILAQSITPFPSVDFCSHLISLWHDYLIKTKYLKQGNLNKNLSDTSPN